MRLAAVIAFLVLIAGCRTLTPPDPASLAALTPRLGQLVLVGFDGTTADDNAELTSLLCEAKVGGILLFARNIVDPPQVKGLTSAIRERAQQCGAPAPVIAVDAEGGRVMRLGPDAGYTPTLSAEELGGSNDLSLTELEAGRVGRMLREAGIDWDLAPVVDVGYNPANPVIVGVGRSFSANPVLVTAHARAFIRGLHGAGVLSALKHFPGHGSSYTDSHLGFVDVTDTADPDLELIPYRALIAEGLADSVMTAHVFNRHLDRRRPATLSRATITGLLRGELHYDGVVVSDDLRMGAIERHYGFADAVVEALAAGVDVLLIADDRLPDGGSATGVALGALARALTSGALDADRVASALERVERFKARRP